MKMGEVKGSKEALKILKKALNHKDDLIHSAESKFKKFFESHSVPMVEFNTKTQKWESVNQAFADLLEYSIEELVGSSYESYIVPDFKDAAGKMIDHIKSTGNQLENEISQFKTKSGKIKTLLWSGSPVLESSKTAHYVCFDITNILLYLKEHLV